MLSYIQMGIIINGNTFLYFLKWQKPDQKLQKDPEFILLYEAEQRLNQISRQVYEMRKKAGLTQEELAKKAHTPQAVIARLESGKDLNRIPSLSLLDGLSMAANAKLQISFEYGV